MIETVEIINYQSHKHTVIEFAPGLNIIKGTSHHGKSSIWRAIYWALFNRPLGEGFKRWSAGKDEPVEVAIQFTDGFLVRRKSKGENIYMVEGVKDDLQALRSDVPDEVRALHRMSEVNVKGQHDPFFLLGDTPGAVAKKINEVAGLSIIDTTTKKVNSIISKSGLKTKALREQLEEKEAQLEQFSELPNLEATEQNIGHKVNELKLVESEFIALTKLKTAIDKNQHVLESNRDWLKVEEHYKRLRVAVGELKQRNIELASLRAYERDISQVLNTITVTKRWLKIENNYKRLVTLQNQLQNASAEHRVLKTLYNSIQQQYSTLNSANKRTQKLEQQLDTLRKQTKTCPLCGRPWNDNKHSKTYQRHNNIND